MAPYLTRQVVRSLDLCANFFNTSMVGLQDIPHDPFLQFMLGTSEAFRLFAGLHCTSVEGSSKYADGLGHVCLMCMKFLVLTS